MQTDTTFLSLSVREGAGMTSLNLIQLKSGRIEQDSGTRFYLQMTMLVFLYLPQGGLEIEKSIQLQGNNSTVEPGILG